MRAKNLIASSFTILGLLLAGCGPAPAPSPAPPSTPAASTDKPKPAAPAVTPAAGAAGQPRRGGGVTLALRVEPDTFDAHQSVTIALFAQIANVYNGVVRYNNTEPDHRGEITGDLARDWELGSDGKSITFRLRPGVTWHDGAPFTSQDVKWNIERVANPPRGMTSPRKQDYASITSVETPDPLTVRLLMKEPSLDFLGDFAADETVMLPKHAVEAKGGNIKDAGSMVPGTGPFIWKQHTPGVGAQLQRNPKYFREGQPFLDTIRTVYIADESTVLSALLTGRVDFLNITASWRPSHMEGLKSRGADKVKTYSFPGLNTFRLVYNLDKPPFNDVRVRRAFNLAIDHQGFRTAVMEGGADIGGYMPPWSEMSIPEQELAQMPGLRADKKADLEEARRLLNEAGLPTPNVKLTYRSPAANLVAAASLWQRNFTEIGAKVDLQGEELAVYNVTLAKRGYDMIIYLFTSPTASPTAILSTFYATGAGRNFNGYSNAEFDRLAAAQVAEVNPAKRKELVIEMQRILFKDVPLSPVNWGRYYYATTGRVQNFNPGIGSRQMSRLDYVWVSG
ncbi:MAG: ABC transporter substrate-binding protein [Chloroflexi bacterium]|nr:ABC transporter substrate-binding protein [Chloroflexota bacterium]